MRVETGRIQIQNIKKLKSSIKNKFYLKKKEKTNQSEQKKPTFC